MAMIPCKVLKIKVERSIFFFTAQESRAMQGVALGLVSVYKLVCDEKRSLNQNTESKLTMSVSTLFSSADIFLFVIARHS